MPRRPLSFVSPLLLLVACAGDALEWRGDARAIPRLPDAGTIALDATGAASATPPPAITPPSDSLRCDGSLRADGPPSDRYAVWWQRRANGSAALVAARSNDGGATWSAAVAVDSLDRATVGCDRPPPSIAVASRTGYVHVAYALVAPEGTGIFFSHSMEKGALFHAPMSIAYGERLARASIAAHGDMVLVAYEDPSASTPRIAAALSLSSGHLFERRFAVTEGATPAVDPRAAVRDSLIAVAWRGPDATEHADQAASVNGAVGAIDAAAGGGKRAFVRIGVLRQ